MPVDSTSSTAASVATLRALSALVNSAGYRTLKATRSATSTSPICVLEPVRIRCQSGSRSSSAAASSRGPGRPPCSCRLLGQGARHGADDLLHRHVAGRELGDALPEPQDLDAVADLQDLGHVVGDEDDRDAAVAHAAD